jgi:rhodanese-related sulfurtransferase
MSKKIRTVNRSSTIIVLAILTLVLSTLAWVSANNLNETITPAARSQVISPDDYQDKFGDGLAHEDLPIVVYCRSGNRSATATRILIEAGFGEVYDLGGIQDWVVQGYPIQ